MLELVLIGGGYVALLLAVLQHSHDHNPDGSIGIIINKMFTIEEVINPLANHDL